MTNSSTRQLSAFGQAALALDEELERFERLTEAAERIQLDSRRNIERATRLLEEAAESQRRLGTCMQALIESLRDARERNERFAEMFQARRQVLAQRLGEVGALFQRFAALGESARGITEAVRAVGERAGAGDPIAEVLADLGGVEAIMNGLLEETRGLAEAAKEVGVAEFVAEVDSLRQQLGAARNRLNLLRQKLAATAIEPRGNGVN